MNLLIGFAFLAIFFSMGSALYFLMRDKGKSNRTVQSLALRVGISISLFLLLLLANHLGWIHPTGLH